MQALFYMLVDDRGDYMLAGPRGHTHRPFGQGVPRLFATRAHAKNAARCWQAGKTIVSYSLDLLSFGAPDDARLDIVPVPERKERSVLIEEVTLQWRE